MSSRTLVAALLIPLLVNTASAQVQGDGLRLPAPTFASAVEAWRDGRADDALIALDDQIAAIGATAADTDRLPLEALVFRATLYAQLGRYAESEADWRVALEREAWIRTFVRRALVASLAARGAAAEAEPILAELSATDASRHLDLTLAVADAYRALGDMGAARRLYQQVIGHQSRGGLADAARLGVAASWEHDGDVAAALGALREAKIHHQRPRTFEVAVAAEQRVRSLYSVELTPFGQSEYRTLVRRLRNASRFEAALTLIDEWRATHAPNRPTAEIEAERIATLYVQRADADAMAACQAFYEHFPQSSLIADIRLTDFRLAVRVVDTERARRSGLALWEGRVPGSTRTHRRDAGTLLAAYLVAVGDVTGGLDLYRQLFQSSQSADEQRAVLWRAGVAALRVGQLDRALTNLRGLIERDPSGDLAPAGLYWLGVAESHQDRAAGTRTLETVAQRFPYHYYGMRARDRLQQQAGDAAVSGETTLTFPELELDRATVERAEYQAAMLLARAGLVDEAAGHLRRLLETDRDQGLALLAARASADAGDHASVTRILVNHFAPYLERPASGLPDDFWTLAYPRPYWDDIRRAATSNGVDPFFLVSLMRQESRFDPDARSTVGAVGLFQIMPYTADALAERAGIADLLGHDSVDESDLARPAVNVAIAARLAGDLFELFDGAAAPTAASYNAGEARVAVWWTTSRGLSEDLFVDTIPYSETRGFVRAVLANRAAYERIYGDQ